MPPPSDAAAAHAPSPDAPSSDAPSSGALPLAGRRVLLGVTGSIAAYKAALLVRLLRRAGADVRVIMTPGAERFISKLTLGTLAEGEVLTDLFPEHETGSWTKHVSLGLWADLLVVAPATAQTLARLAHGFCDTMLAATVLSAKCPVMVCPAMDRDMIQHPATEANLDRLRGYGVDVMPSAHGELASGLVGPGRMPEPEAILARIAERLRAPAETAGQDAPAPVPASLAGQTVLVTAGPTREPIDPVRVFTNRSTGTMGYALAEAAAARGGRVRLVSGPTALATPPGVAERVDVETAEEMHAAVMARADADLVLMAAAVADFTPVDPAAHKIKKQAARAAPADDALAGDASEANQNGAKEDGLVLHLRRTPDILKTLGQRKRPGQTLVGFALETDDGPAHAQAKLRRKHLDWIALNSPLDPGGGFGADTNRVTLFAADGRAVALPTLPKRAVADAMLAHVLGEPTPHAAAAAPSDA